MSQGQIYQESSKPPTLQEQIRRHPALALAAGLPRPLAPVANQKLYVRGVWPKPHHPPRRVAASTAFPPSPRRSDAVRVGLVTPGLHRGGAEQWMLSMIDHCDRSRVHWVGMAVLYPQHHDPRTQAAFHRRVPVGVGGGAVEELYRRVDVAVVWGINGLDQRVPERPRNPKVVLVSHGIGPWTARVFEQSEEADAVVAVSRAALAPMPAEARDRATVITNCHEPSRIVPKGSRDAARGAWGAGPGETVVGFLGRLSDEKNPAALVELAAAAPGVRGVYVGTGAGEAALRSLAASRGVADRIVFHAAVDAPGDVLAAFDRLLLPSHEEACSITLLEAWAAGVPVLATPVGLVPEHPDLVRLLPARPTGEQTRAALEQDLADAGGTGERVGRAKRVAEAEHSPQLFGREWTRFLVELGGLAPALREWFDEAVSLARGNCGCDGRKAGRPPRAVHEGLEPMEAAPGAATAHAPSGLASIET